jgi:ABC-type spermidine/putrescine transport system permease subunit II
MASGALFAFAASFDDVVIALLIAGPEQRTCRARCSAACATASRPR